MRSDGRRILSAIMKSLVALVTGCGLAVLFALTAADEASAQFFGRRGYGGGGSYGGGMHANPGMPGSYGTRSRYGDRWGQGPRPSGYHPDANPNRGGGKYGSPGGNRYGDSGERGEWRYRYPRRPWYGRIPIEPIERGVVVTGPPPPSLRVSEPPPSGRNARTGGGGRVGTGVPAATERRYVPDEVVFELALNTAEGVVEALARRHRLNRIDSFNSQLVNRTVYRWRIPDRRSVPAVVRALEADPVVIAAQPNYIATLQQGSASAAPALPLEQYAVAKLQLQQAHTLATGAKVLIAVIDSGIDATHPELAGMIAQTYDATGIGEKPHRHGTGIAGAMVAHARLTGTAPGAQILSVQAFAPINGKDEGTTFGILKGLDWAVGQGARIINMSFTQPHDPAEERSFAAAYAKGVVLIAAAGNAGPKAAPLYPAADPNVIAVTATDADDKLFTGANRGRHIAVAAPGVDVVLPGLDATYQISTGTSFAAAEVSGAVALLLERKPALDPASVRRILMSTARDLGTKGIDPLFGAGLVDAYQAVRAVEPATVGSANPRAAPEARK